MSREPSYLWQKLAAPVSILVVYRGCTLADGEAIKNVIAGDSVLVTSMFFAHLTLSGPQRSRAEQEAEESMTSGVMDFPIALVFSDINMENLLYHYNLDLFIISFALIPALFVEIVFKATVGC